MIIRNETMIAMKKVINEWDQSNHSIFKRLGVNAAGKRSTQQVEFLTQRFLEEFRISWLARAPIILVMAGRIFHYSEYLKPISVSRDIMTSIVK